MGSRANAEKELQEDPLATPVSGSRRHGWFTLNPYTRTPKPKEAL